ncbi:MAG: HEAT repeat domain-containing protein [Myxococcales bacterium]|nr:HEAT repeat domain-containing protein [Myxococcales bacterium]
MSTKNHWLTHRGALEDVVSDGHHLVFVTAHPEGQPTGVYRADPLAGTLQHQAMPGAVALAATADGRFVAAGTDGRVWVGPFGSMAPVGAAFEPPAVGVAPVATGVAVVYGASLVILGADGTEQGRFGLEAAATAVASDPSGQWVVVGCADGTVAAFTAEEGGVFVAAESASLHRGEVTALRFEKDELRFRSLGADNRFLITHARGALEPLDRGTSHGHARPARGIEGDGERVYTVGEDGEIKAWQRGNKRQPATQKQGVGTAVAMAMVQVDGQDHVAVATDDSSIRLFPIEEDGKVGDRVLRLWGAIPTAQHELEQNEPERRRGALDTLAGYADAESIEILAISATSDADHQLRVRAADLLGAMDNPRAGPALEQLLSTDTEAVRRSALTGLRRHAGTADLRPLKLALDASYADIGVVAVHALTQPAAGDELAHVMLVGALSHRQDVVRNAALSALESLHPDDPTASLLGLRSSIPQLRWRALLRLLQRELLQPADRALRTATEDADADVRQLAYQLRLLAVPSLAAHLRAVDADLHRNLHGLQTRPVDDAEGQPADRGDPPPAPAAPAEPPATIAPLLQASGSRYRDTCLRGSSHLAALGDGRAFGVLLQLSREGEPDIQVRACRALILLDDPRALGRMQAMLREDAEQVRDAAFTVVERLLDHAPLQAAEIGLSAPHVDIRRRGLRLLIANLETSGPSEPALVLLRRALDDTDAKIRMDAFKAVLRLGIGGQGEGALRFALQSLQDDVRREVLTELMGEVRHDWAWALLLERFNDAAKRLRDETFAFARKQTRGRDAEAVVAALRSEYADLRLQAVGVLASRIDDRARPLLVEALDDDDEDVRRSAFSALQRAGETEAMVGALSSRHADVRIDAAASLAEAGRLEAMSALLEQVTTERPEVGDLAALWKTYVLRALQGLAWLRDPAAVGPVTALLDDEDGELRVAAARTLAWVAPGAATLSSRIQHSDEAVRHKLALGLAWRGDPTGAPLVFGGSSSGADRVSAALGLSDDEQLLSLLDASDRSVRALALRVVLLLEWVRRDFPERLMAGLTVSDPRVRLAVAEVLEAYNQSDTLAAAVAEQINDQGDNPAWPVDVSVLRRMAIVLASADGLRKAAVVDVLRLWDRGGRSTQDAQVGAEHAAHRFQLVVSRSRGAIETLPDPGPAPAVDVTDLVFGTYVGLSGQVGGRSGALVRASALGRLSRMQGVSTQAVIDALIPALADSNGTVRAAAFQALQSAGLPTDRLAAEALSTGQRDLGQLALTLLADTGGADVLWDVLLERDDGLELVAMDLLRERVGEHATDSRALDARSAQARDRAVHLLASRYENSEAAGVLRGALTSRFPDVRRSAALALARHRDGAAYEALVALLVDDDWQSAAINGLAELGDPRAATALLDRWENDPRGTAETYAILDAVADLRSPAVVDRLVALLRRHDDDANGILDAMTTISGYDQRLVFEPDEPDADESWRKGQHPRHDEVLAKVLQLRADRRDSWRLRQLMPGVTWSKGSDVDAPLTRMLHHADDQIRRSAVVALGWRVRHRHASDEALRALLTHKDPATSFLAAEGLARAGASAGLTVLLAAVDTLDEIQLRHRAVLALGYLGDARALDKLLDILDNDEHALIESAAEAIGHLRDSPQRDRILQRLLGLSRGSGGVARRSLVGLRWFGSPDAWTRIRAVADSPDWYTRETVAELLRHDDTATSAESRRTLELRLREERHYRVAPALARSLRRLLGTESLEADYAYMTAARWVAEEDTIARLRERGDASRILDALADPACQDGFVEPLLMGLASREPLPLEAALSKLGDARPKAGTLAARLVGRAGALDEAQRTTLRQAASMSLDDWEARRQRDENLVAATERVRWMLWAAVKQGAGSELIVRTLKLGGQHVEPLRSAAADALPLMPQVTDALLEVLRTGDARARGLAAGTLVRIDRARAEQVVGQHLDDRAVAEPILAAGVVPAELAAAASQVHVQGVALPHLVAARQLGPLQQALTSEFEGVRLGAVDALGALASEDAEGVLVAFASNAEHEEEERKAAWRAVRRSKRQRARQEGAP